MFYMTKPLNQQSSETLRAMIRLIQGDEGKKKLVEILKKREFKLNQH